MRVWELRRLGLLSAKRVLKINVGNLHLVLAMVLDVTRLLPVAHGMGRIKH